MVANLEKIQSPIEEESANLFHKIPVVVPGMDEDNIAKILSKSEKKLEKKLKQDSVDIEYDREETLVIAEWMLQRHQDHLEQYPSDGKNYFRFPHAPQDLVDLNRALPDEVVGSIVHYWIHGDISDSLSHKFDPRAIGSWLLTLVQADPQRVNFFAKATKFDKNSQDLIPQLTHLEELYCILNPKKIDDFNSLIQKYRILLHEFETRRMEIDLRDRSAVSLFEYGIVTDEFSHIFDSHNNRIILNEFGRQHIPALEAAIKFPTVLSTKTDSRIALLLALTGAQVRSGQRDALAIFERYENKSIDSENNVDLSLQILFASEDRDAITDQRLCQILEQPFTSEQIGSLLISLIVARRTVHPNSFLVPNLKDVDLAADTALILIRSALDVTYGDLSKLDPIVREVLEREYAGVISPKFSASVTQACMGFGADLPKTVERYLSSDENKFAFMDFLSVEFKWPTRAIYSELFNYPISPVYAFLSRGIESLPTQLRSIFRELIKNQSVCNDLSREIFSSLFNDGYFRFFFNSVQNEVKYPEPTVHFNDKRKNLWEIVHPDIWQILSKLETQTFQALIKDKLPDEQVEMEYFTRSKKHVVWKTVQLSECLPPEISKRVYPDGIDPSSLRQRLLKTVNVIRKRTSIAQEKRIDSTDSIRSTLLPMAAKHGINLFTQLRLVHRHHMRGNEHIVLDPRQASRILQNTKLRELDRLGGIYRSKDKLPITIKFGRSIFCCPSCVATPELLVSLTQTAEKLFPLQTFNAEVNEKNIYHFVSAFQYYLALIHPFYECNGRTSEDFMYVLWNRRPDLGETVRYVSADGSREGEEVNERMKIINDGALSIVKTIAVQMGMSQKDAVKLKNYYGMTRVLKKKMGKTYDETEEEYLKILDSYMADIIPKMVSFDELRGNSTIDALAKHLQACSATYLTR